ncbi:hypothetical protein PAXINDRAFT_102777 [Paxillus involutus ATCC 200175]|uniref:BTB domain-containing protein n=1 Tax=Paxillus involutus ATCC 200175 TaxID=664439 RepID=A0A0C9SNG2_PAXIN|nr:hypothetical protein PAXINDRAFT_102777 [Paxillus involutus ATCC 200175]
MSVSTYAASPFDHAKADVILRSSDNIDFRVFKLFLSLASPFFATLFDIPQPTEQSEEQESKDGLAVISVSEDSSTLDALLRFCYPCTLAEHPSLENLKEIVDVLDAAKKYSLDTIERKVGQALSNPKILEVEPLRCFAIAHRGQLRDETLLAARYTLGQPLIPSWFEEIELLTATDLLALLTYHQKCGDAAYALKTDTSWIKTHYGSSQACSWLSGYYTSSQGSRKQCKCPKTDTPKYKVYASDSLQWWEDFMEKTLLALRGKPCGATVMTSVEETVQYVKGLGCSGCSPQIAESMRSFSALFVREVEEKVSKVTLELKF